MKHGDESHGIESLRSPSDWKIFIPLPSATRWEQMVTIDVIADPLKVSSWSFRQIVFEKNDLRFPLVPWCFSDKKWLEKCRKYMIFTHLDVPGS